MGPKKLGIVHAAVGHAGRWGRPSPTLTLPNVWLNATARTVPIGPPSNSFTGTCSASSCILTLTSAAGLLNGDTVSGTILDGTGKSYPIADKTTVLEPPASNVVTISAQSSLSGSSVSSQVGMNSAMLYFKNVIELECLYAPSTSCTQTGMLLDIGTAEHIDAIELSDGELNNQTSLDAEFNGGTLGLNSLIGWMDNPPNGRTNVINLALSIGNPTSYSTSPKLSCNDSVLPRNTAGLHGGGAVQEDIASVVMTLGNAFVSQGFTQSSSFTIRLDLDEPLNQAYDSFVGTTGTGDSQQNPGLRCPVGTLASLGASILAEYQFDWNTHSNFPHVTFLMGGDESIAGLYDTPTFVDDKDLATFIDAFHTRAMHPFTIQQQMYTLPTSEQYYDFFIFDLGTTENDWKPRALAVLNQVKNQSAACANDRCPRFGTIFAVLNGETMAPSCPLRLPYWSMDNSFCDNDAAAVAAAQVKIQDYLKYATSDGNALLIPKIIRLSSYDKTSPSHLLPNKDPSSLTSVIDWLFTPAAQVPPPNLIYKLYNGIQHRDETDLGIVEMMLASGTWRAEYPLGEIPPPGSPAPPSGNLVLSLIRYECNTDSAAPSDYLSVNGPPPNNTCSYTKTQTLGYAASAPDNCALLSSGNNYVNSCPNAADIPVYQFTRMVGGVMQWYYSINKMDMSAQGWSGPSDPVFFVQPILPLYEDNEPIAFQGGLRVASQDGSTAQQGGLLQFFTSNPVTFGFQVDQALNGSVIGIGLSGATNPEHLICNGPGSLFNCGGMQDDPVVCLRQPSAYLSLSCATIEGNGIAQALWGNPASGGGNGCCGVSESNFPAARYPVMHFYPYAPYTTTYSYDNSCFKPLQSMCP